MLTCDQEVHTSGLAERQPEEQRDLEKNLGEKKAIQSLAEHNLRAEQGDKQDLRAM